MSFFLITVLIGTVYPIFLEVLTKQQISIGPPYYNKVLAPFLIPLLFAMAYGPKTDWITSKPFKIKQVFLKLSLSIIMTFVIIHLINKKDFLINLLLVFSLYLIIQNLIDLIKNLKDKSKKNFINKSSLISHLGFGFLIFFISLNSITSIEQDLNIKVGEKKQLQNFEITLDELKVYDDKNFKKFVGSVVILNKKKNTIERLKPEIRVYSSPETITYEASIKSNFFADTYVTMSNISRSEFYNIKFQKKPFMNLIWFSTILIVFGGFLRIVDRKF